MKKVYPVQIIVLPRPALLDPEGETIEAAIRRLGYEGVRQVRAGRAFSMEIEADSDAEARHIAESLAQKLLHNPVVETYEIRIVSAERAFS